MRRREFIGLLGCTAAQSLVRPLSARAQTAPKIFRIGHINSAFQLVLTSPLGRVLINQEARRGAFDVRLSPNSGAKADIAGDPRSAMNRHRAGIHLCKRGRRQECCDPKMHAFRMPGPLWLIAALGLSRPQSLPLFEPPRLPIRECMRSLRDPPNGLGATIVRPPARCPLPS
jgi:hypothetical protein